MPLILSRQSAYVVLEVAHLISSYPSNAGKQSTSFESVVVQVFRAILCHWSYLDPLIW
jgi:hypothetical protein